MCDCVKLNHVLTVCAVPWYWCWAMVVFSICHQIFFSPSFHPKHFDFFSRTHFIRLNLFDLSISSCRFIRMYTWRFPIKQYLRSNSSVELLYTRCMIMKHKLQTEVLYSTAMLRNRLQIRADEFFSPSSIHSLQAPPLAFAFSLLSIFCGTPLLSASFDFVLFLRYPISFRINFFPFFVHCFL